MNNYRIRPICQPSLLCSNC